MNGTLEIALADPSQLMMIDEVGLLLGKQLRDQGRHAVADLRPAEEDRAVAARAGRSQRRLHARRDRRGEASDETLSIDRLTDRGRHPPVIRWWTPPSSPRWSGGPATSTSRRATTSVIKYRIDGVLQQAMPPIAKELPFHHHFAHQGDERAGHRRAPRAAGRPLPRALQAAAPSTSASPSCPPSTARTPCCACWTRSR